MRAMETKIAPSGIKTKTEKHFSLHTLVIRLPKSSRVPSLRVVAAYRSEERQCHLEEKGEVEKLGSKIGLCERNRHQSLMVEDFEIQ